MLHNKDLLICFHPHVSALMPSMLTITIHYFIQKNNKRSYDHDGFCHSYAWQVER